MVEEINKPVSPGGRLLWLGAGSLAHGFAQLAEAGQWREIIAARRNIERLGPGFTVCAMDFLSDSDGRRLAAMAADAVVVSLTPPARSDDGYRQGYVETSRNIISALQQWQQPPGRVVWVSSTSVYGQNSGESVDETSPTQTTGFSGKRLLEAEALWQASGLPVSVVRFSGIYGPGRNRLLQQVEKGNLGGEIPTYTNRIHQTDCARVIAHLLDDKHDAGVYIGTDDESVLDWTVKSWLAQQLGVAHQVPALPTTVAGKRLSNHKLKGQGFSFAYPSYRHGYPEIIKAYRQRV
ncbi:NAD-dependent epimerase/dehydratase family protein [Halioxenophilus aromaticivorans]|uniref:SDR family oxidoreductase n=1 Tax=Halioxenophilus aromaticivorans TaxID=1306992 RepID=A0AAV3TXA9_9ALTE